MLPLHEDKRWIGLGWPQTLLLAPLYFAVYIGLDRISYVHSVQSTEISPWSPMIAWQIIVVLLCGLRAAPATILAPALAELVLRQAGPFSVQPIAAAGSIGCVYTAAGLVIRRLQRQFPQLSMRWLTLVLVVIAIAALLDALLYSAALVAAGDISDAAYLHTARIDWVGDMNGIIVLLPLFIISFSAQKPWQFPQPKSNLLLAAQLAALAVAFWFSFFFARNPRNDLFYLLFLPVIWIALRWGVGLTSIVLAVVQLGIVFLVAPDYSAESFLAVQLLMVLLAGTGLYMGISTSQNARYAAIVRAHDDQAAKLNAQMAVSEMHSAIAHELNNPLAALLNYVQSASIMLDQPGSASQAVRAAIGKAQSEAERSVEVLRRLRTFYRAGEVHREATDLRQLALECLAGMQARMQKAGISCTMESTEKVPPVHADPLQMSIVMQNLLLNAIEEVSALAPERRRLGIALRRVADAVEFHVRDHGRGMPAALGEQLFRPLQSAKASGMGLGLAICRALIEANDGRIWLARSDGQGSELAFSLPVGAA